jgi:Domain of unknown function (DUF5916)/Carbohydrate family 9 binding domain-like
MKLDGANESRLPGTEIAASSGRRTASCLLMALVLPAGAWASEADDAAEVRPRSVYRVERTESTVEIDGQLDEAVWKKEPTFLLDFETRPAENEKAPVRTEVWITYDVNDLYVGIKAYDPEPAAIRARYSDRDSAYSDDFVGVIFDTFNDERRAFEFFVNPLGVQMDLTQNEMTGNEDDSWDAIWDSAGRITAEGYEVEMRIPFSSLRFPRSSDEMTWGATAIRLYPRDQRHHLDLQPLMRGNNCFLCQIAKLQGFAGVEPARSIELDPTLTASQTATRPDFPNGSLEDGNTDTEPGLTAHWGITPNLTFTGALNPDFSQVEADVAQLDVNTQFALFYPEKRPFFLEGADLFDTRFNAIYSRNIADPLWGAKVTGKEGPNALGVIVARDRTTNFLIPSSQSSDLASFDEENTSSVIRYRRDLFGSTTGGFFYTGREGDGFHNRVFGSDVLFRWNDTEAARVELLGSATQYPSQIAEDYGQSADPISDMAIRAVYQHTSRNWMYYVLYRDVGSDFRADLGFVPQADFRERNASLERAWYPEKGGWTQLRLGAEFDGFDDHDGQRLERRAQVYTWAQGPRQSFVQLALFAGDQFYNGETFETDHLNAFGEAQVAKNVYVSLDSTVGDRVDFANTRQGKQLRLDPGLRLDLGRHLRLNLDHSYETLDVDQGKLFTANLTQLRATYQFNVRSLVRVVSQYLDVERDPLLYVNVVDRVSKSLFNQLLYSYKINPQTVLFLGYSDSHFGDEGLDLTQESRTLFFKVGYAWLL